jgi:glutaredoxin 3
MLKTTLTLALMTAFGLVGFYQCVAKEHIPQVKIVKENVLTSQEKGKKFMAHVELYSTTVCPFCVKAKNLLDQKGVKYTEYKVDSDMEQRKKMLERSNGARTVPQIFINNKHIGGCDDLYKLNDKGELDKLLEEELGKEA